MRIDPNGIIAGHPSKLMREVLRRGRAGPWHAHLVRDVLNINLAEANGVIEELKNMGFIEVTEGSADLWTNTVRGNALANSSAAKPIHRSTAAKALQAFLERVGDVNRDAYYLYRVRSVVLFGSYLSGGPLLNDVDVAVMVVAKTSNPDERHRLDRERISAALRDGRRFSNIVQEISWPQTEVWLKLKSRSRALSLHDLKDDAPLIASGPYTVLLNEGPDDPLESAVSEWPANDAQTRYHSHRWNRGPTER